MESIMLDLADLRIFLAVVNEGGILKASRKLHRVPSSITTRIQRLRASAGKTPLHPPQRPPPPPRRAPARNGRRRSPPPRAGGRPPPRAPPPPACSASARSRARPRAAC